MKFSVENLGRVDSAKLEIEGITLVVGPNGCGKSTISRALTTWLTCLRQLDMRLIEARGGTVLERVEKFLVEKGVSRYLLLRRRRRWDPRLLQKLLDLSFWRNREEVSRLLIGRHLYASSSLANESGEADRILNEHADEILDIVAAVQSIKGEQFESYVISAAFEQAFVDAVGSLFDREGFTNVGLVSDQGGLSEVEFERGKVRFANLGEKALPPPVFYIEPRHLLDEYSSVASWNRRFATLGDRTGGGGDSDWYDLLFRRAPGRAFSFDETALRDRMNDELDKIGQSIHGQIVREDREIRFMDRDAGRSVSVLNAASGAKTMAVLERGFRTGVMQPGCLLVIDEPETNLHPEWQVRFAEFLVLLQAQLNVKILLNTHSPYFLKAVKTYADRLETSDRMRYYNMVPSNKRDHMFRSLDVTQNVEPVFADMSRPYARLVYGDSYDRI